MNTKELEKQLAKIWGLSRYKNHWIDEESYNVDNRLMETIDLLEKVIKPREEECTCKCHEGFVRGGMKLKCEACGSVYLGKGEKFIHLSTQKEELPKPKHRKMINTKEFVKNAKKVRKSLVEESEYLAKNER